MIFVSFRACSQERLDGIRDVVIALADTLVTADLGVLTLPLLHERLELGVIALGDGLGLHLDGQVAAGGLDALSDVDDGLLQSADTQALVQACAGEDIQRWRHKLDLDLGVVVVLGLGSAERSLDGIDTLVAEAGNLNIGSDLGGLRSESLADVELQLIRDRLAGEGDVVPHLRVATSLSVTGCLQIQWVRTNVMESLKASMAWPYLRLSGQPMLSYSDSMGTMVFSATCLMMECTILLLL